MNDHRSFLENKVLPFFDKLADSSDNMVAHRLTAKARWTKIINQTYGGEIVRLAIRFSDPRINEWYNSVDHNRMVVFPLPPTALNEELFRNSVTDGGTVDMEIRAYEVIDAYASFLPSDQVTKPLSIYTYISDDGAYAGEHVEKRKLGKGVFGVGFGTTPITWVADWALNGQIKGRNVMHGSRPQPDAFDVVIDIFQFVEQTPFQFVLPRQRQSVYHYAEALSVDNESLSGHTATRYSLLPREEEFGSLREIRIANYESYSRKDTDDELLYVFQDTFLYEQNSWKARKQPVLAGTKIKKIQSIRNITTKVVLEDGRSGWIYIPFVSPKKGKNGYVFRDFNSSDIKLEPRFDSSSARPTANDSSDSVYERNQKLEVLGWFFDQEEFSKTESMRSIWARIKIKGSNENALLVGWIRYNNIRLNGQKSNLAIPALWVPIKAISRLLGDGIIAGIVIILGYYLPSFVALRLSVWVSRRWRFLPNFVLSLFILAFATLVYIIVYDSVFDASSFNRNNWRNEGMHFLFIFLTGCALLAGIGSAWQKVRETRCPNCRMWSGEATERELVDSQTWKTTSTTTYSDGKKEKAVSYSTEEDWVDHCECKHCGYQWKIHRHVKH